MRRTLVTLAGLALTVPLVSAPAQAGEVQPGPTPNGPPTVMARGLAGPLSLDVTPSGTAWFSQNFAGALMRQRVGGPARVVYRNRRGSEVGAVSAQGRRTTFAISGQQGAAALMSWTRRGGVQRVANLARFERNHNPDGGTTYGIMDLADGCEVPRFLRPYTGIVESHPYATTSMGGVRYVADAAANAILGVADDGRVSTVALLPAQPSLITAEAAEANGLPPCTAGATFNFEPVPTDVERGPDGMLYVTTLPGGPEDPSLGARAAVHRIDPASGDVTTVATGLLSATGLAVAPNGDMYVAELFGNRISKIPAGSSSPVRWSRASLPGDVEYLEGQVWATRKVLAAGQVVRYNGGVVRPVG